jgi:competence protein ComEC
LKPSPFSLALAVLVAAVLILSACQPASIYPAPTPRGIIQVHFIDVGQGDSVLILTPGGRSVLIDGGEARSGALEYLKAQGVRQLDLVVATHPHDDHIGGLPEILKAIPTAKVATSGQSHTTPGYERFLDAIIESRAEYIEVKRGDMITLDGLNFEVLHPASITGENMNNNSVVLRLVYGKISFIFMGDAEKAAEAGILTARQPISASVIKLGHHGSRTSTSPEFLSAVSPALAVYSAGRGNRYGHPHQETLDALAAAGVVVYGTDLHGSIIVSSDGTGYQVSSGQTALDPAQTAQPLFLDKPSVTSPVAPGGLGTVTTRTLPGAEASIKVYVKSGLSQAQGLEAKKAGPDGSLTWTWRVGPSTSEGEYRIEVTASKGGETITRETTYTVRK